jgi:hypothetical protein
MSAVGWPRRGTHGLLLGQTADFGTASFRQQSGDLRTLLSTPFTVPPAHATLTTGRYGLTRAGLSPAGLRQPHWRFREFHPEPLTDPYVKASRLIRLVPSREGCRLPLNEGLIPAYRLAQSNGGDPPPSLELHDKAFITYMMVSVAETPGRDDPDRQGRERRAPRRGDLGSATRSPNPQGLPSSPVQLRSAVWTGVTRDTRPSPNSNPSFPNSSPVVFRQPTRLRACTTSTLSISGARRAMGSDQLA